MHSLGLVHGLINRLGAALRTFIRSPQAARTRAHEPRHSPKSQSARLVAESVGNGESSRRAFLTKLAAAVGTLSAWRASPLGATPVGVPSAGGAGDLPGLANTALGGMTGVLWPARGEGSRPNPTPFVVGVPEAVLGDLRDRLRNTRWPDQFSSFPWEDGTDAAFMQNLVVYWRDRFDWRAHERAMNELPQFLVTLEGLSLHYVHVRGRGPNPLPLVLTHGWPGSFLEFRKLIPMLTDPASFGGDPKDSFDVVVPSLPGYGFSERPRGAAGLTVERIAALWTGLMTDVLGYERFGAHGSDVGAGVTSLLGLTAPEHVLGIHVTTVAGSALVRHLGPGSPPLSEDERRFLQEVEAWSEAEGAYAHLQRTKPQTLAYGLHDSPAGLAAWIVEKYRAWSDCDGDVERRFSMDELLTTITLYWATGTLNSSIHLYFEGRRHPRRLVANERVEVPCAVALFPRDLNRPPRTWGERAYNIARWTEMPRGGHFPAHEEPRLLAQDLREFFRPYRV